MIHKLLPIWMFEHGYTGLISVTPPTAALSPGSKISASQLGKAPGIRFANGTWGGYDWQHAVASIDDVKSWMQIGANVGLRAGRFPGLDIDTLDPQLAETIETMAMQIVGPAPVRLGRAPKRLLMYQAVEPFARMRMFLEDAAGGKHLIEMLGEGQQYLVYGVHPFTKQPYTWVTEPPPAAELTGVSLKLIESFFEAVGSHFAGLGFRITREGDGRRHERVVGPQDALQAPSDDDLAQAVDQIPNTDALFPTREDYIKFGYAVKAAAHDAERGYEIFWSWAERWEGHEGGNDPDTTRSDWRRMRPPYSVGWEWIAGLARTHGKYNDAGLAFPPIMDAPPSDVDPQADAEEGDQRKRVRYSERWLAVQVVSRIGDRIRFSPDTGKWLVWDGYRWQHDAMQLVRTEAVRVLHEIASDYYTAGLGTKAEKEITARARWMESAQTLSNVLKIAAVNPAITVPASALDTDPWILNTPGGVVNLKTGAIKQADPRELVTKLTKVGPDATMPTPVWTQFLKEATGGDKEVEAYLQRFVGYALSGSIREQTVEFFYGPGGNGKGTFARVIRNILADYGVVAPMAIFTEQKYDGHTTDLAMLMGARFVWASETEEGKRWNEQRLKALSGGDPITARFMRADNFTFNPQFKLLFTANSAPAVRTMDAAIRRRLHIVGFNFAPPTVDRDLEDKLQPEYPGILAWAIQGALAWQVTGLKPPQAVLAATADYFESEDSISRWMDEALERGDPDFDSNAGTSKPPSYPYRASGSDLFESWREWAGANGEYVGNTKRLANALHARGIKKVKSHGVMTYLGVLVKRQLPQAVE